MLTRRSKSGLTLRGTRKSPASCSINSTKIYWVLGELCSDSKTSSTGTDEEDADSEQQMPTAAMDQRRTMAATMLQMTLTMTARQRTTSWIDINGGMHWESHIALLIPGHPRKIDTGGL
jgi:hypothetical protein